MMPLLLNAWLLLITSLAFIFFILPGSCLLVACTPLFPKARQPGLSRWAVKVFGRTILALPYPFIRIKYRDLAPSFTQGACVIVCNHRSASDAFLMARLSFDGIQVFKKWVLRIPLLGFMARRAGYLCVNDLPTEELMEEALAVLRQNLAIVFFPEGTRSGNRQMNTFYSAAFRLALQAQVPIVPLCIAGNEHIPSRGTLRMEPGVILMHKLKEWTPDQFKGSTPYALKNKIRDTMSAELAVMDKELGS
jgi:1-acyl-sn-glycerol-3-phosphate acyltransferase